MWRGKVVGFQEQKQMLEKCKAYQSACVYAQVVWVGLQLTELRDTWKGQAEGGISLEFWLQD